MFSLKYLSLGKTVTKNSFIHEFHTQQEPPVDTCKLNYIIAILLGAGTLFAYNAIIAGGDYYKASFPGKKLEYYAPMATSIISPFLQFLGIHLVLALGKNICIYTTLVGNAICVVLVPILIAQLNVQDGFNAALACMLAIGAFGAVNLVTIFPLFASFPFLFLQAVMMGQGLSGVIVSVLRVVTRAIYPHTDEGNQQSARLYFTVAGSFTLFCVVAYTVLKCTPFAKYYLGKAEAEALKAKAIEEENRHAINDEPLLANVHGDSAENLPSSMGTVMCNILPAIFNISSIFIVTFLSFPGLMLSIAPTIDIDEGDFNTYNILLFNVFDFIGRTLPSIGLLWNEKNVHIPVIFRFITYPLFILAAKSHYAFFNSSYFVFGLIAFFAVSNGYLSSIVMMTASNFSSPQDREMTSSLMSTFLTASILVGSMLALGIDSIFWS